MLENNSCPSWQGWRETPKEARPDLNPLTFQINQNSNLIDLILLNPQAIGKNKKFCTEQTQTSQNKWKLLGRHRFFLMEEKIINSWNLS